MSDHAPTLAPKNKVIAATGGAAIGTAVSTILLWLISDKFGLKLPDNVHAAFDTIFTTAVTLAAGYYTPPSINEGSVLHTDGKVKSGLKTADIPEARESNIVEAGDSASR